MTINLISHSRNKKIHNITIQLRSQFRERGFFLSRFQVRIIIIGGRQKKKVARVCKALMQFIFNVNSLSLFLLLSLSFTNFFAVAYFSVYADTKLILRT